MPINNRRSNHHQNNYSSGKSFNCVVCCHSIPGPSRREIFAIGPCDHPICYHCSTKMRAFCQQFECPICRQEIPEAIFTESPNKKYLDFRDKRSLIYNNQFRIHFETESCLDAFGWLLKEKCKLCKNGCSPFNNVQDLQDHLHTNHGLYLCELCVQNLRIFSDERKYYKRHELQNHMQRGDSNDKSYQGHPACNFCNKRYMDEEELNIHLRRDHFYCHLCSQTRAIFYDTYEDLNRHFRHNHYLCEEGPCKHEQFLSVFRNEIELQAHRAQVHCLTKSEAKHARTLTLDLTFNPFPRGGARNSDPVEAAFREDGSHNRRKHNDRRERNASPPLEEEYDLLGAAARPPEQQLPPQQLPRPEDFPSLGAFGPYSSSEANRDASQPTAASIARNSNSKNDNSSKKSQKKAVNDNASNSSKFSSKFEGSSSYQKRGEEEFPALCAFDGASSLPSSSTHFPSISLAEAIKSKSNKKSENSDTKSASSSKTKTSNSNRGQSKSESAHSRSVNSNNRNHNEIFREEFHYENDFPSLPFKVTGNKKKKKALNSMLSIMQESGRLSPPNLKSIRLVKAEELSDLDENRENINAKNILEVEDFPPLSGESEPKKKSKKSPKNNVQSERNSKPETSSKKQEKGNTELSLNAIAQQLIQKSKSPPSSYSTSEKSKENKDSKNNTSDDSKKGSKKDKKATNDLQNGAREIKEVHEVSTCDKDHKKEESKLRSQKKEQEPSFIPPDDFDRRNQELLDTLERILGNRFPQFRDYSIDFQSDDLAPDLYYQKCVDMFGSRLNQILLELIVLLPDVKKQKQLLSAHEAYVRQKKGAIPKRIHQSGVWELRPEFEIDFVVCPLCGQVLSKKDGPDHMTRHSKCEVGS